MEYARLIHDFVDGSLDSGKEQELFTMLSSSEELRADLKQQLAIKSAVRSDTAAFSPSADSTLKIFGALGFTTPPAPAPTPTLAPAPVPSGILSKLGSIFRNYSQGIIGGVVSAVATSLLLTVAFQSGLFNSGNEQIVKQTLTAKTPDAERNVPVVESRALEQTEPVTKERIIYKNIYIPVEAVKNESPTPIQEISADAPAGSNSEDVGESKKFLFVTETLGKQLNRTTQLDFGSRSIFISPINAPMATGNDITPLLGLSFEISGAQYFSLPEETVSPERFQKFNNMSFSAMYSLSDEWGVGIEYRRENFFQRYSGIRNEQAYIYEQQPNFESYGFQVRFSPAAFSNEYLQPYAQLAIGGNEAGPVGRAMLGGELFAGRYFSLLLGFEYSELRFKHQAQTNLISRKAGVQFGTKLKF